MRRREWDEQNAATFQADELERKRSVRAAVTQARLDCPHCDDDGWALGEDGTPLDPAVRCEQHAAVSHA
jgi:hypothetical protein